MLFEEFDILGEKNLFVPDGVKLVFSEQVKSLGGAHEVCLTL